MFDQGTGPAVVVIPGVQGRWEWMKPALDELRKRLRTVSYTLAGDPGSGVAFDDSLGFENYVRQIDSVLLRTGIERAAFCGVSYGGLIALRYAATRPGRVTSLILASSPAPGWIPTDRQRQYVSRPWRSLPAFVMGAPVRLWPEIRAAHDTSPQRLVFAARHAARVLAAPAVPPLMAARIVLQQTIDFDGDCANVKAPTLVITGEDGLDQVVPPAVTRRYLTLIAGAEYTQMTRSGHIGLISRPMHFADIVTNFVSRHER